MNYDYLPINNDGVRWRLVAVTTALLITAAAERYKPFCINAYE